MRDIDKMIAEMKKALEIDSQIQQSISSLKNRYIVTDAVIAIHSYSLSTSMVVDLSIAIPELKGKLCDALAEEERKRRASERLWNGG